MVRACGPVRCLEVQTVRVGLRERAGQLLRPALVSGAFLALGAFLCPSSSLRAESSPAVIVTSDIPYLGSERAEKMDAYLPPASFPRPLPALLYIHGGAWVMGDKAEARAKNIGSTLAAQGIAVFSINYQLNKKAAGQQAMEVVWPQNFYDCKSAVRFLRKEGGAYGIDPDRIGVMGASAGGHLALLVGSTAHAEKWNQGGLYTGQDSAVKCIIDFYGIPDLKRFGRNAFAGKSAEETERNLVDASPVTHIGTETPPILIVHGAADKLVNPELSRDFVKLLRDKGIAHEWIEIPGAQHAFDLQPAERDLRPAVLAFLDKYLVKSASAP
jgi:acetyl esterase/lipase